MAAAVVYLRIAYGQTAGIPYHTLHYHILYFLVHFVGVTNNVSFHFNLYLT